jgi:hypothetical protein
MDWISANIFLPMFVLMLLVAFAGGKPDSVPKFFFDLFATVITGFFRVATEVLRLLFDRRKTNTNRSTPGSPRAPSPRNPRSPRDDG